MRSNSVLGILVGRVQRGTGATADGVDDDVDAAELGHRLVDRAVRVRLLGDVRGDQQGLRSKALDLLCDFDSVRP